MYMYKRRVGILVGGGGREERAEERDREGDVAVDVFLICGEGLFKLLEFSQSLEGMQRCSSLKRSVASHSKS